MIQAGSIVAVQNKGEIPPELLPHVKWLPIMDSETPYVVRSIDGMYATLEEGIVGYYCGEEICFNSHILIELLPPGEMVIEDIIEEIMLV